jgi:hypothetical protein
VGDGKVGGRCTRICSVEWDEKCKRNVVRVKSSQPRVGMLFVNMVCVDISPNSSLQLDTYLLIQAN